MRFSGGRWWGVFSILALTLLTESCIKSKRERAQPECLHGKDADGHCRSAPARPAAAKVCQGNFGIKESGTTCIFHTAEHPNGCLVSGLHARKGPNLGCVVSDSNNHHCTLANLDRAERLCEASARVACDPAAVSIYLEVQENGFKPHIAFDQGEKVKAGATLELGEQRYRGSDVVSSDSLVDGRKILSMDLKIPWTLDYTKEDGTEVQAGGVVSANNKSKDTAARGEICPL